MRKAGLIGRYFGRGLTQRQIGEAVEYVNQYVGRLMLYGRFMATLPAGNVAAAVTENRFRMYWLQVADTAMTRGRRSVDHAYEAECFAAIRALIAAGKPPMKKKPS